MSMNLLLQQVNEKQNPISIFKGNDLFFLDNDTKHLNIDLPSTDNSNNQVSRMHSSGTKPMDVRAMN